jgi:hypothetical protein
VSTASNKLATAILTRMFLFSVLSFTELDYLSASAVGAGEHAFLFSHLKDSDPSQLPLFRFLIPLHLIHRPKNKHKLSASIKIMLVSYMTIFFSVISYSVQNNPNNINYVIHILCSFSYTALIICTCTLALVSINIQKINKITDDEIIDSKIK